MCRAKGFARVSSVKVARVSSVSVARGTSGRVYSCVGCESCSRVERKRRSCAERWCFLCLEQKSLFVSCA